MTFTCTSNKLQSNWNTHAYFAALFVCLQAVSRTFNSLYKVLFNFPSRYLFTIGLTVVFSLSRSLPAALGCTLKQPDSNIRLLEVSCDGHEITATGLSPAMALYSKRLAVPSQLPANHKRIHVAPLWYMITMYSLHAGLFPFHSPLLRESRLFSFPPLNNMLKFSGCSCLMWGCVVGI